MNSSLLMQSYIARENIPLSFLKNDGPYFIKAIKIVINNGLNILGISSPERM